MTPNTGERRDLTARVKALEAAILDIDAHAHAMGSDDDGFNSGGYIISIGSLHRALGLVGHTAARPREHAVQIVTAHGEGCEGCEQMVEVAFDAIRNMPPNGRPNRG